MASFQSHLINFGLRAIRAKRHTASAAGIQRYVAAARCRRVAEPSRAMLRRYHVERRDVRGHRVYSIHPQQTATSLHVVYFHGGAYVLDVVELHWKFIDRLIQQLRCTVTVPLYPLAPEHDYVQCLDWVGGIYCELLAHVAPANLVLMGDSCGGGLALALAQRLAGEGQPQPGHVVLFSPWLDVTMSDPLVPALDRIDPFLSAPGLVEAGRLYAGRANPRIPQVSPIYGPVQGLPPITVFAAGHDVLLPDARRLKARCEAAGCRLNYFEYDGMVHTWVLFDVPETRQALRQIQNILGVA
jgi:acetyl esterase/lipase